MKLIKISTYFILFLSIASCKQKVEVPAYIVINQLKITSDYLKQGSTAAAITDVWVYVDGNLNGIYPLPCKFPVIALGSHRISVQPGIKENGSSNTRINYPFYGTFDTTLTLEAEKEYMVSPWVSYRSSTKMDYFEDFESGGFRLKPTSLNNSTNFSITQDPSEVFEGKASAKCVLNKDTVMEYVTTDEYSLPGNGVETFIEINYKSEADMMIGFYQHAGSQVERYPMVGLYASNEWKKSYIKITQEVGTQIIKYPGKVSYFSIFIKAENLDDKPKKVLIDNIKLVRF